MSAYGGGLGGAGGGNIDPSPRMSDDRLQIIQWHLSQIESAKEQVDEANRQLETSKADVERLEE